MSYLVLNHSANFTGGVLAANIPGKKDNLPVLPVDNTALITRNARDLPGVRFHQIQGPPQLAVDDAVMRDTGLKIEGPTLIYADGSRFAKTKDAVVIIPGLKLPMGPGVISRYLIYQAKPNQIEGTFSNGQTFFLNKPNNGK